MADGRQPAIDASDSERMPAGRDLDALVADRVIGLKPCSNPTGRCEAAQMTPPQCWGYGRAGSDLASYSTDIAAAFEVVEKMRADWSFVLRNDINGWQCSFGPKNLTFGETVPLAICHAALKALAQP